MVCVRSLEIDNYPNINLLDYQVREFQEFCMNSEKPDAISASSNFSQISKYANTFFTPQKCPRMNHSFGFSEICIETTSHSN